MLGKSHVDKHTCQYHELLYCMNSFPQTFEEHLKSALNEGYPIDYVSTISTTLLTQSIFSDVATDAGIPDILLRYNANPNIPNSYGMGALAEAVSCYRSISLINNIIDAGAEINSTDEDGRTAFYWVAVEYITNSDVSKAAHALTMAIFLLERGANPYLCNHWIEDSVRDVECFDNYSPEYVEMLTKVTTELGTSNNVSLSHMNHILENATKLTSALNQNIDYKEHVANWRTYYFRLKEIKEICDSYC